MFSSIFFCDFNFVEGVGFQRSYSRLPVFSWNGFRFSHGTASGFLMERLPVFSWNGFWFSHGTSTITIFRKQFASNAFRVAANVPPIPRSLESVSGFLMERCLVSSWNGVWFPYGRCPVFSWNGARFLHGPLPVD